MTTGLREFAARLGQTIAWCSRRYPERGCSHLRTPALAQPSLLETKGATARVVIVDDLCAERAALLRDPVEIPSSCDEILFLCVEETCFDGAAEVYSGGFFDFENSPPWDTWISLVLDPESHFSFLIAWVPPDLVQAVNQGIWANPEQCIGWLSDVDAPFARELKSAGFGRNRPLPAHKK